MSSQPHDVLFHWLIAHPEEARALLTGLLPPALVRVVDWSRLQVEVARLDVPELTTRVPDAVCRAPLLFGGTLEIALVSEHQSGPDADMPFRVFLSQALLWSEDDRRGRPRSIAIGLVIHHGPRPWSSPRTVRERFALPAELDAVLGPLLPSHPYLVVDLATMDAATLARLPIASPLVRASLFALQRARESVAIEDELALVADDLRAIATRADAEQALTAVFRYLLAVAPERAEPIRSRLSRTLPNDLEARIMGTIFDEHIEKGIAIGRAEGRAAVLTEQLEARFGAVSAHHRDLVAHASAEQIAVWARRVLFAASADEVFASRS